MNRKSNHLPVTTAVLAWSGAICIGTYVLARQWYRRRLLQVREERVLRQGGLMPTAKNVVHALELRATDPKTRDKPALVRSPQEGDDDDNIYSWADYYQHVQNWSRALVARPASGGVAIHAFNCPEWFICAMGALAAGWTVSGIYLTNTYAQAAHILQTSEVRVLVLGSERIWEDTYADKLVWNDLPPDFVVVLLETGPTFQSTHRVMSYHDFVHSVADTSAVTLPRPSELSSDNVATLVYTSGTTGNPKAVELTLASIYEVCTLMHARIPLSDKDIIVSYLPLSHIAAMGIDLFQPIFCGAVVHFANARALQGTLKDTLLRVRPTLFFGVPRVWEKLAAAMQNAAAEQYRKPVSGSILKTMGTLAKFVGSAWWDYNTPEIVRCGLLVIPYAFFKKVAFAKIRRKCGLDRCQLLYTGAAPLSADTLKYLRSVDMPVLEVFGMSESAGAIAVCGPSDAIRPLGACGRPLPGGQLTIGSVDGEIIWKGRNNMRGYKGLPAATAAVLDDQYGLHTGDLGRVDDQGRLYITGRKKDIIITAGGENVAPIPIEEAFMSLLGGEAGHVVLIGDQRKFLTVLIAPTEVGTTPTPDQVKEALASYNENLAMSRAQRVQKAHVIDKPFTVEAGDLTPTMKLKRNVVVRKYASEIEAMYAQTSGLVGYSSTDIGSLLK